MKTMTFMFIVVFSMTTYNLFAQKKEEKSKNETMKFEVTIHDFGQMTSKNDGTFDFIFENTGKEPIILKGVRSSCGCATAKWSREPVLQGGKGHIKVKYSMNTIGTFVKTIIVFSNAENSPVTLTIKGEVRK